MSNNPLDYSTYSDATVDDHHVVAARKALQEDRDEL